MGVCCYEQMRSRRNENLENFEPEDENEIPLKIKYNKISNSKEKIRNEAIINNNPIILIPDKVITATKSLCKIFIGNQASSGFLIKLFKVDEDFFCLMTNEHVITKDIIKNKEKIKFYYDNESKSKEIYLNK